MAEAEKLQKRLNARMAQACREYELIEPGDHIMVCLSGGKDSYTLLEMLMDLQQRAPVEFRLFAFHLDQKQPGYPEGIMKDYLEAKGIPYEICEEDTYGVVKEKLAPEATPCSLCSRLRRGIIYTRAEVHGCNKIALGHHRDDSVETLLLNLFFSGQMQAMPARYTTDDGRFDVIRPLLYAAEDDIREYARLKGFPIIPCNLCGSIEGKRKFIREKLDELEETIPHVRHSILAAMSNIRSTHLLDKSLWNAVEGRPATPRVEPAGGE